MCDYCDRRLVPAIADLTAELRDGGMGRTLGDLVAERPGVAPTLDRLDVAAVVDALGAVAPGGAGATADASWTALGVAALADHIESTHHAYLHAELPELVALADRVRAVHGSRHPELAQVARLVDAIAPAHPQGEPLAVPPGDQASEP